MSKFYKVWPNLTLGVWLNLIPVAILFGVEWTVSYRLFELSPNTIKFWEYLIYGWLYTATTYWVGLGLILRFTRQRWLAALFSWFYLFLMAVNIAFLHHAGLVLMPYYVWAVSWTNWITYLTPWVILLTVVFGALCGLAAFLIQRHKKPLQELRLTLLLGLVVALWAAPQIRDLGYFRPTKVLAAVASAESRGAWRTDQTYVLRMISENPLVNFVHAIVRRPSPIKVHPTSELAGMKETLSAWHLPLGPRSYPPLDLKPFNHIIVFAIESLSLDFLAPYNASLPPDLTPFYGSSAMIQEMFTNYYCVAVPTQYGLSVTYNSHPNASGLLTGNYDGSLIKQLNAQGFETYYVMSAPGRFLDNDKIFGRMGFKHILGSEVWSKDPAKEPFVEGWGLMDRVLFHTALDILATNRDNRTFIHVINTDTHSPDPRKYYGALEYPAAPADLHKYARDADALGILKSVFRHDHDMGLMLKELQERNLLTEDTLVILTADHNYPQGAAPRQISGYPSTDYSRLPLVFLSGQKLPEADHAMPHSQLDFAPTIMHLLGQPIPEGWWGQSIFAAVPPAPYVAKLRRTLIYRDSGSETIVQLDYPQDTNQKGLVRLFNSLYWDQEDVGPSGLDDLSRAAPSQ